jgi:hypothetical protein
MFKVPVKKPATVLIPWLAKNYVGSSITDIGKELFTSCEKSLPGSYHGIKKPRGHESARGLECLVS